MSLKIISKLMYIVMTLWLTFALTLVSMVHSNEATSEQPSSQAEPGTMSDIHDIKPLVAVPNELPWVVILMVVILLTILLSTFFYWRRSRKLSEIRDVEVELPPEVNAHRALDQIDPVDQIDGKMFYFRLSAILRKYLYERFGINAPEMTTEELLPRILSLGIGSELQDGLEKLCRGADPIKYAGASSQVQQMASDLAFARSFVDGTTVNVTSDDPSNAGVSMPVEADSSS